MNSNGSEENENGVRVSDLALKYGLVKSSICTILHLRLESAPVIYSFVLYSIVFIFFY